MSLGMRLCVYQLQALRAKEQESSVTYFMCMMKFNYPDAMMECSHFALSLPTHTPTTPHSSNPEGEGRKCLSSAMRPTLLCGTVATKSEIFDFILTQCFPQTQFDSHESLSCFTLLFSLELHV